MVEDIQTSGVTDAAPVSAPSQDAAGSPPAQSTSAPPQEPSAQAVKTETSNQNETESDPLAGLPTIQELEQAVAQKIPMAEGLLRLRTEYEKIAPQFKEISTKFKTFEPVADRFGSPEEVTNLVEMRDELFKQNRTDDGYLVPDPSGFATRIAREAPVTADYLTSQLIWGKTVDQRTGQEVPRIVPLLENIAEEPTLRAQALQILGAVEPSQIPQPTWTASQEELDKLEIPGNPKRTAEIQELYKKLPFEEREELRLASPEYIRSEIERRELVDRLTREQKDRETRDAQVLEQERQAFRQATETAGAQYVDQSIKEGFNGLVQGIVKDWQPTDDPAMNKVAASFVGVVTTALAHGETRFAGAALLEALKEMGIQVDLTPFDKSLNSYVDQARNYGELSFVAERQRHPAAKSSGNGDRSITYYKTEANRGLGTLVANSRTVAGQLMKALDKFFVTRADAHNQNLDSATQARPVASGAPAPAQSGNPYLGKRPSEIYGR